MARVCPLFSGSSGNCIYIGSGTGGLLIDAGVSAKRIEQSLFDRDIDPRSVSAVFITHEHSDHIQGISILAKRYGMKIYASNGTLSDMAAHDKLPAGADIHPLTADDCVCEQELYIRPFKTMHDAAESFGYVVQTPDDRKIALATDLGVMTQEVMDAVSGCDMVILESNHDISMLSAGSYPYYLKRRILSPYGHLSNEACAAVLPALISSGTTRFVLAHLSRENNLPDLAYQTALSELVQFGMEADEDYKLIVAPPESTERMIVF